LYPETGDFVAVFGNKIARFRIQSLLFREQAWTGLNADVRALPVTDMAAISSISNLQQQQQARYGTASEA